MAAVASLLSLFIHVHGTGELGEREVFAAFVIPESVPTGASPALVWHNSTTGEHRPVL